MASILVIPIDSSIRTYDFDLRTTRYHKFFLGGIGSPIRVLLRIIDKNGKSQSTVERELNISIVEVPTVRQSQE